MIFLTVYFSSQNIFVRLCLFRNYTKSCNPMHVYRYTHTDGKQVENVFLYDCFCYDPISLLMTLMSGNIYNASALLLIPSPNDTTLYLYIPYESCNHESHTFMT